MSGGPSCRVTYLDYLERVFGMLGLGDYRRIFERNWFALRNFHCGYYQDSEVLNGYLGHFRDSLEDHLQQLDDAFPRWMKIGSSVCPKPLIKAYMKRMAEPLQWVDQGNDAYLNAFFGSRQAWEAIPGWDEAPIGGAASPAPDAAPVGRAEAMNAAGLEAFAASRGGTCEVREFSDPAQRLRWTCARGHEFEASPRLLVVAGYWCPTCAPRVDDVSGWDYAEKSKHDPLLAAFV
jgi:hypothetical protein